MSADLHDHLAPAIAAIRSEEVVPAGESPIFLVVDDLRRQRIRWAWGFVMIVSAGVLACYTYGIYW